MKLLFLLLVPSLYTAAQPATFQKAFGGDQSDYMQSLAVTANGDIIQAGSTSSYGAIAFSSDQNIYIIKTDSLGNLMWSKTFSYNNSYIDESIGIIADNQESFIYSVNNFRDSLYGNLFFGISQLDMQGNILWNKKYSLGGKACFASSVKQVNKGFLIAGAVYSDTLNNNDAFLLKINENGIPFWCKVYSTQPNYQDKIFNISDASNGNLLLSGVSFYNPTHDYAALIIKTDSSGNIKWMNNYANSFNSRAVGAKELPDGSVIAAGQAVNYGQGANDFLLFKTDSNGSVLWSKVYGDADIQLASSAEFNANDLLICGTTNSSPVAKAVVIRTDYNGNIISSYQYGDSVSSSTAKKIISLPGGTALISGEKNGVFSQGYSAEDYFLLKTDSMIHSGCEESAVTFSTDSVVILFTSFSGTDTVNATQQDIQFVESSGYHDTTYCQLNTSTAEMTVSREHVSVYPNPSTGRITISTPGVDSKIVSFLIYDITGKYMAAYYLISNNENYPVDLSLTNGLYFITFIKENGGREYGRIIISD